ncbi:hypothetical protein [Alkanindiges illinoisensis]|uniref:Uncharacterized protein n=1 Tax=Alkanindiges illinoisensis TaxID=197183 RepID=A0A4Y7X963_9GAMM|nr:hypothetical protein [Alkanindiges illinoisensis]TEU23336.1 hypothetical protein E2B99_13535 [Alkanindiges illinoisensis]
MPAKPIELSDQELEVVQEVQLFLGLASVEQTIEFLLRQRLQEKLLQLAGREIQTNPRHSL